MEAVEYSSRSKIDDQFHTCHQTAFLNLQRCLLIAERRLLAGQKSLFKLRIY